MKDYKSLFLRQSYLDAYDAYIQTLECPETKCWDYIILTASNESQAQTYREQIDYRLRQGKLPKQTSYAVIPDPDGKRVGSGGATLNVLRYIKEHSGCDSFEGMKILVIHSGGDSKRVPQYSACGKLFSPVPRELPDGRRSTLFDEFVINMTGVPARITDGMLVCSGDVLLLFNPLQLDFYTKGAVALSMKENVETGKNHGVFYRDEDGFVGKFLHKQSVETLTTLGAVDTSGNVNIDTGAVIFDSNILNDLWKLVDSKEKFSAMVNDTVRLSFYADFLYPLASQSTLEQFYLEQPEGEFSEELSRCREQLWKVLHPYQMKLICFSPSSFIHFGTTRELLYLMTEEMESYRFLDWSTHVNTNVHDTSFSASNSFVSNGGVMVGKGTYIEDSILLPGTKVGNHCVVSGIVMNGQELPDHVVLHGLKLNNGKFVARVYGVEDNPKQKQWLGMELSQPLWGEPLFPACDTMEDAVNLSLEVLQAKELGNLTTVINDLQEHYTMMSLQESFQQADGAAIIPWLIRVEDRVKAERLLESIDQGICFDKTKNIFLDGISDRVVDFLLKCADQNDRDEKVSICETSAALEDNDLRRLESFSKKIRIYYYLSKLCDGRQKEKYENLCFDTICQETMENTLENQLTYTDDLRIKENKVIVKCPVRVNFGGGWSDTPPYCNEHGGTVLNAAISIEGRYPIEVQIERIDEWKVVLSSADYGSYKEFESLQELQDCRSPHDPYALHKAALIACGILPFVGGEESLSEILQRLGGGFSLSTQVINIPRGSGLGTSSILAGACVKAIFDFLGRGITEDELYGRTLCLEQIMSTGGGWQDQVGGLSKGIKMITSVPGLRQQIECTPLHISKETLDELQSRFCIIYTGQRRLARNLLREVVGKYIGNAEESIDVLYEIQRMAVLMRFELEKGDVDTFAKLLTEHWELSKRLDQGCTNTCINQIFLACDDLIDGKMICGAGGGGFLQVVLKKGVSIDEIKERLNSVFAGSGVDVWRCEFV